MSFSKSMRHPDVEFPIRRADVRDAAVIARHRARMFHDMGEISDEALDDFLAASQAWTERALVSGEYIGWLAAPQTDLAVIVAGAGVQRRQVPPHPCRPSRDGVFAKGRHAIVLNVFTEPEWRNRGIAELLMVQIIRWAREEKLDRLVLHASAQARSLYERMGFVPTNEMRFSDAL
jgi:GNAT superfamily N-acetyltransferase